MKEFASRHSIVLPYLVVLVVGLLRLQASYPYHFIPVFSSLLFFAVRRPAREFAAPLIALAGVDIFLTVYHYGYPLTIGHGVTWLWYLAALFLGMGMLRKSSSVGRAVGASLLASVSFFVVSNFTVWMEWGIYPQTLSGLGACYIAALPYLRNSLIAESLCSLLLFGLSAHAMHMLPAKRPQGACS